MRVVVERVKQARVDVDGQCVGQIDHGYLIYLGITHTDTMATVKKMAQKVLNLRVFEDENQKLNLNINQVSGSILVVSQFTLYGNVKGNNRPSFTMAAKPDIAKPLYDAFIKQLSESCHVETGIFQTHMAVTATNDGPVTLFIEY